jgi:hypothetical protein
MTAGALSVTIQRQDNSRMIFWHEFLLLCSLIVTNYMSGPFAAMLDQTFRSDQMTQEGDDKLRNVLMERASLAYLML